MSDDTRATILIIENDDDTRRVYADVLSYTGACLLEAGNPYEAFDYLRTHSISLIVTDLCMPGGGLQYLATLREREPGCPIVTITGLGGADTMRQATLIAGATAFLEKPIRAKQLREIVHRFLFSRPIAV
jgi:two-component system response regulator FlrC